MTGAGVICAEWTAAGLSDPELEQWASGFASADAAGAQLQQGGTRWRVSAPTRSKRGWAMRCRRHPQEPLAVALVVWSLYRGRRPVVGVSPEAPTTPVGRSWS